MTYTHTHRASPYTLTSRSLENAQDCTERWIMMIRHRGWGQLTRDRVGYKSAAKCCGTPRAVLQGVIKARCAFMCAPRRLDPMILTADTHPQMLDWFSSSWYLWLGSEGDAAVMNISCFKCFSPYSCILSMMFFVGIVFF